MDTFVLILSFELLLTFVCVGSPLVAYRIYHRTQGITTQRLTNRARIGVMVLVFIALIAVLSLVLFTIHPPASKFSVPIFYVLFLVSSFIFNWTSPIPPPPGSQRLRLFSFLCLIIAIGGFSLLLIDSLVGFLR